MKTVSNRFYLGIDVQASKGCPYAVFDTALNLVRSGWLECNSLAGWGTMFRDLTRSLEKELGVLPAIGIDSPRSPLPYPRKFYWNGKKQQWEERENRGLGYGRHCEVIIKALNLANPQWTPVAGRCPMWMLIGFELFKGLNEQSEVFEVFPTASYNILDNEDVPKFRIHLSNFLRGPKDMLDACVAAITVREFLAGRGCAVGGGDALGAIILPRPLPGSVPSSLLEWPPE